MDTLRKLSMLGKEYMKSKVTSCTEVVTKSVSIRKE